MMKLDDDFRLKAIDKKLVVFRFDIDRKYAKSDAIRRHESLTLITPEMDAEFNEMLTRWEKIRR